MLTTKTKKLEVQFNRPMKSSFLACSKKPLCELRFGEFFKRMIESNLAGISGPETAAYFTLQAV